MSAGACGRRRALPGAGTGQVPPAPAEGASSAPSGLKRSQSVVVPGTEAAALIAPSLARSLTAVLDQRRLLEKRLDELLESHPLSAVLTSMPGDGVRTAARLLIDVGDGTKFPSAAHPLDQGHRGTPRQIPEPAMRRPGRRCGFRSSAGPGRGLTLSNSPTFNDFCESLSERGARSPILAL